MERKRGKETGGEERSGRRGTEDGKGKKEASLSLSLPRERAERIKGRSGRKDVGYRVGGRTRGPRAFPIIIPPACHGEEADLGTKA